jgi:NAD(P)-dependent dehydrogenase (short-subunit alcohol dehydrogenase family)
MEIRDKVAIVTGAASGIGSAIARKYKAEGARGIVLADVNLSRAQEVAREVGGVAVHCDVSREADLVAAVELAHRNFGSVDIFVSNAGILGRQGGLDLEDELWGAMWNIHVMAHVWAARAVVPEMVNRGEGYFVVTASAAGLLALVESPAYSVTKHAAVAFAEWLRIAYGRRGVRVSCLCPQAVQTDMVKQGGGSAGVDGVIAPEQVADTLVDAMRNESFLVLPHPEVLQYFRNKGSDYDRWLGGMQKVYARAMQGRDGS